MNSLKLTIKDWALVSLSAVTGILVLILGYKSKQLSAAHVSLLKEKYANTMDKLNAERAAAALKARSASGTYSVARRKYEEEHGPV